MKTIKVHTKQILILTLLTTFTFSQAIAETESKKLKKGHSEHQQHKNEEYHGVFYGLLPCKDCDGTKTTLSLKNRNNYLLVTQPAKPTAREYFEKGKYNWDEDNKVVTLTSRKGSNIRKYRINDEKTLTQLSSDGTSLKNNQKNTSYNLRKRDMVKKNTSMHGH